MYNLSTWSKNIPDVCANCVASTADNLDGWADIPTGCSDGCRCGWRDSTFDHQDSGWFPEKLQVTETAHVLHWIHTLVDTRHGVQWVRFHQYYWLIIKSKLAGLDLFLPVRNGPNAEVNASGGFVEPGAVVSCREVRASEVKEDGSHCGEKWWIYMDLYGFIWIYMDLLGCKWGAHGIIAYNPWLSLIYGNLWSYKWHYKVGLSWDFLIG